MEWFRDHEKDFKAKNFKAGTMAMLGGNQIF